MAQWLSVNPRTLPALVVLLASTPAMAEGPETALGPAENAAVELLRGNAKGARSIIASMGTAKNDPAALVVLACLALEDGAPADTALIAERLRGLRPKALEGRLLGALARERATNPRGDWLSAGITALTKVRPLPSSPPLLDAAERIPLTIYAGSTPFPEEKASKLSAADAFVARWAWPRGPERKPTPSLVEAAIRFANADERPLVHLAALDVLDDAKASGTAESTEAVATARRAIEARLRDTPAGRRRLVGLMARGATQPVEESEVVAFEAAVAAAPPPAYASDFADLYRILDRVDRFYAPTLAFSAAVDLSINPPFLVGLGDRLRKGGLSPTMRARLGAALVRWADQQQREGTILADMLAALALTRASDLVGDGSLKDRAYAIKAEDDGLRDALRCLHPLLRLPLPSLHRAWATQAPAERTLAQQIVRMGLSCPEPVAAAPDSTPEPTKPCPDDTPAQPKTP